jgi:hypothetical protein
MISLREPTILNIISFIDGLRLVMEITSKKHQRNAYYCGYDCDTMINNVLVFGPDGKVYFCAINYPGSWGDGTLTIHFSHTLRKGLVIIKYESIRASCGVVMQLGF